MESAQYRYSDTYLEFTNLDGGIEMSYVYIRSEPNLWTVGFYDPEGRWQAESDWESKEQAAERVHWLNGGIRRDDD